MSFLSRRLAAQIRSNLDEAVEYLDRSQLQPGGEEIRYLEKMLADAVYLKSLAKRARGLSRQINSADEGTKGQRHGI